MKDGLAVAVLILKEAVAVFPGTELPEVPAANVLRFGALILLFAIWAAVARVGVSSCIAVSSHRPSFVS